MIEAIDTALRYVSSKHNEAVMLRDATVAAGKRALEYGRIAEALHADTLRVGYEGEIKGLEVATVQLQMVRERSES